MLTPNASYAQIVRSNAYNEDPYVRGFGVNIDGRMMEVQGRLLPPPTVSNPKSIVPKRKVAGPHSSDIGCVSPLFLFVRRLILSPFQNDYVFQGPECLNIRVLNVQIHLH